MRESSRTPEFLDLTSLQRYAIPVVGLSLATGMSLLIRPAFAEHSIVTIMYLVAVLASSWFGGYGPGLLACLTGLFVIPYLFAPNFNPLHVDLIRAALVLLVSLLISRVAEVQNRIQKALREANQMLDTRVRERTAELQRSNEDLKRLNDALNEFAYSASHDLQQPLRNMAIYSQILERKYAGKLDDEADQYLRTIVRGTREMSSLLEDLLAYSRSINIERTEEIAVISVNATLQDALANLKGQIEESNVKFRIGELPQTRMHRFHLLALFQNLVGNAIKYRSEEPPVIEIGAEREIDFWKISVADNGIGIAPEFAKQIFGLFKRLHSSESYEGTGVGLAICDRIVAHYGGRIWVEPRNPRGSTFHFTVPLAERGPSVPDVQVSQAATS